MEQLILAEAIRNVNLLPGPQPIYQCVISLILSQQVSFRSSRRLRANLYEYLGTNQLTPQNIKSVPDEQWTKWGLNSHRRELIQKITNLASISELRINDLANISGIGPWTLNGLKIMTYSEPNIFLYEDGFIRKRLRNLFGNLTLNQIRRLGDTPVWDGQRSLVSRFLWRLRDTGVSKLLKGEEIAPEDLYL